MRNNMIFGSVHFVRNNFLLSFAQYISLNQLNQGETVRSSCIRETNGGKNQPSTHSINWIIQPKQYYSKWTHKHYQFKWWTTTTKNGTQIANKMKYTHYVGCLAVKWKQFWSVRAGEGEKESANVNPIIAQIKIICINLVSIKKAFCTFLMKCGADVNEQKWHSANARLQTK